MPDIIQLLPDSVANQIAAGEVVQRPASVVKELLENAVDAQSRSIEVNVRDGGKALIQVVDDGIGMSETDSRLCFERHATSKIREANDLFAIKTMGFRGEALASIAAVAEVELRTRRSVDEVGTLIRISGSEVVDHEPVGCSVGSSVTVKNLFFNVPARRKFLKSSSLELKHVIGEFQRVALSKNHIGFILNHNGAGIYNVPAAPLKQRIISLMGRSLNQHLLDLNTNTSVVKITGYIGDPQSAKKTPGEQFFFVNGRFMKNPYLHKALMMAYEKLLPQDAIPPYFIFLEVDPQNIDVNIHPTKTEIKFEDERVLWQILHASVKEALGKFAVVPSIDFESEMVIDIPFFPKSAPVSPPEVEINPNYNPFNGEHAGRIPKGYSHKPSETSVKGWQNLFHQERGSGFEDTETRKSTDLFDEGSSGVVFPNAAQRFFQLKNRYILTSVKSGLMIIDQKRAHERILYENYLLNLSMGPVSTQQELFPQSIDLSAGDLALLSSLVDDLATLGVSISFLGQNTISVNALPANLKISSPEQLIHDFINSFKEDVGNQSIDVHQKLSKALAKASSIPYNRKLEPIEMQDLVDKLFACQFPSISPDGKPTITTITTDELDKRF